MSLEGRRAVITGAGGKLGKIIAETLAELGSDLVLIDRTEHAINELMETLTKVWNINVDYRVCDLEKQEERTQLISYIKNHELGINILVNNAAFVGDSELEGWAVPFEQQTTETWRRAFEVNLTAIFELCQGLMPLLKAAKGPNIINIASIYGVNGPDWGLYQDTGMANPAAYSASKGGLIQLTKWLATTTAPFVRVNAISPGGIYRGQPELFVNRYNQRTPLGRMAIEKDISGAVAYLASDLSSYVTGQNLLIDGGWSCW